MTRAFVLVRIRHDLNVWSIAYRSSLMGVVVLGDTQHTMLRTVSNICTDVEAALIWFGGMTYAIVRGHSFTARQEDEIYDQGLVGVYVDDREHGLLLLSMGFTP